MSRFLAVFARVRVPFAIFLLSAGVYCAVAGKALTRPTPDNHFVHLARSFMHGELGVLGNKPPSQNDYACYDTVEHGQCPLYKYSFPESERDRYKWYVSFPPFPAVVIMPLVAVWGLHTLDRLFWCILAGLAPALLYVLLRMLRERGYSTRKPWEDVVLTALFAFGTVYFFTAVHGSVWFAAHVVACSLLALFLLFSVEARRPFWAGLMLGLAFMTRPTMMFVGLVFLFEAIRMARGADAGAVDGDAWWWTRVRMSLQGVRWGEVVRKVAVFSAPVLVIGCVAMWMNEARFDNPFEFGHKYLQIRWRPRIETWGLFNFHYFAKNLGVFLAALPWLSAHAPYLKISRHGLALWVTTPALLMVPWPKRTIPLMKTLAISAGLIAIMNLCYQNSGWVQFGYRFALDYMALLIVLLALGARRFGPGFFAMMIFAFAINTFGAITFDREGRFYDDDATQDVIFQPD